jgi:hypothetical protein
MPDGQDSRMNPPGSVPAQPFAAPAAAGDQVDDPKDDQPGEWDEQFNEAADDAAASIDIPQSGPRLRRQVLTAWVASAAIHIIILIIAALITVGGGQAGGASAEDPEPIGLAILSEEELGSLADAAVDHSTPSITEALDDPLAVQVDLLIPETLTAFDQPLDMSQTATELTSGLGAGDLSGGSLGGAGGTASFFGVEAKGTRFAYIIDISGSMEIGVAGTNISRLDVLKRELYGSVAGLTEHARFFIATFSHESYPLGGKLEWTRSTEAGKTWARRSIIQLKAEGGTHPLPAFELVFTLRPRPDAIYFMTDGEFDGDSPRRIALLNADLRIPIHCICFDSAEGETLMRRIAQDSGGTYTFVSGGAGGGGGGR